MSTRSHLSVAGGDGDRRPARRRKTDTTVVSGYDYPRNPLLQYKPDPDPTGCPACAWRKVKLCPVHLTWQAAADYYGHITDTAATGEERQRLAGLIDCSLPEDLTGLETADIEATADAILAAGWRPPIGAAAASDWPASEPRFEVEQPLLLRGTLRCVVARREWTAVGWVYLVALHPRGTPASAREAEFTALPPGEHHDTTKGTP
ncbi:hypothetical protein P3102_35420 [Amycolatopsis sp. QT-25]|uniref:hypothetical protein n=1 Tax=Amycolatopsis sp. QT-25 TaxID=3034022 RepID=UPI0023EBC939|nr:hypothetical protein [Amycolatopsis sp. QT-25]WET79261.1 hypothetical protein P3102_35420 [Amycolatopsis sp. QT-25]